MKINKLKSMIEYLINIDKSDVPENILSNIDNDYIKLKKSSHNNWCCGNHVYLHHGGNNTNLLS